MALDLYQRLGLKRGASEAEIKKAYRSLAKQLHPDRNKDNPNAAKRFSEVTAAYDLLSDKDKRARYDRGEIDEEGNPKMPFGSGFGGFGGAGPRPGAGPQGLREFQLRRCRCCRLQRPVRRTVQRRQRSAEQGRRRLSAAFVSAPRLAKRRRRRLPAQNSVRGRCRAEAAADHARRRQDDRSQAPAGG